MKKQTVAPKATFKPIRKRQNKVQVLSNDISSSYNKLREVKITSTISPITLVESENEITLKLVGEMAPVFGDFSEEIFVGYDFLNGEFIFNGAGIVTLGLKYLLVEQSDYDTLVDFNIYMRRDGVDSIIGNRPVYITGPSIEDDLSYSFNYQDGDAVWITYTITGNVVTLADIYPTKALTVKLTQITEPDLNNYYTKAESDAAVAGYYTATEIDNLFANYYTKSQSNNLLTVLHKSQIATLTKRADGGFDLTTQLMEENGISIAVFDGMKISFRLPSTTPYNWQDKVNPLIYVDGLDGVPLVNSVWFYSDPKYNNLDKNTLTAGLNTVTYDAESNLWAYSSSEYTVGQFYVFGNSLDIPGFLRLQGIDVGDQLNYPTYPGIFNTDKPNFTLDFADTAIVGASLNSPMYKIVNGQIQNITGNFSLSSTTNGLTPIAQWTTSGAFAGNVVSGIKNVATGVQGGTGTVNQVNFDASKIVKTGAETLTKRYALTYYFKL